MARFIDRYGARRMLVVAATAGVVGFVVLTVANDQPWQVIVAEILANAYTSLGYGALPAPVDAGDTGVATGMNAIARTIGSSLCRGRGRGVAGPHGAGHSGAD